MSELFVRREVRELTEQAKSAITSYNLFQVRKFTKHAAARKPVLQASWMSFNNVPIPSAIIPEVQAAQPR